MGREHLGVDLAGGDACLYGGHIGFATGHVSLGFLDLLRGTLESLVALALLGV